MSEGPSEELTHLRRTVRDLAALSELSAVWGGYDFGHIAEGLAEVVQKVLGLDLVYVQVSNSKEVFQAVRGQEGDQPQEAAAIGGALHPWLGEPFHPTAEIPHPFGEGTLRIAMTRFGCDGGSGLLVAGSSRLDFPTEEEHLLLRAAANQAVAAIQRKWVEEERLELLEREQEAHKEARILNDLAQTLGAELDLQNLLQRVTDAATELTDARFGAFFYNAISEEGEAYMLYTLSGAPREAFERFGHPRNTEVFGPTFRGEGVIRLDDVLKDPRYGKMPPHYGMPKGHLPVRSYLAVPVTSRSGEVLGGLFFGHPQPGVFTERAERLVLGLASHAAIAIDNARLFNRARSEIAERRRAEESERAARTQAERASRLRDEFLATVSHELRTPLNSVLGWTQVLRLEPRDEDTKTRAVNAIERGARAQLRLVEDLLDMSRIIAGKLRLDVQTVDLISIVHAAIETIQPAAQAKNIRVERVLDPLAGPIKGDPARLQQIFWNLLSNAVKFTPKGGRVQIHLERVNSHLEVSVSDTGQGIEPEYLPQVFDRFSQADSSTTRHHGGLGLGLAVVKNLVELHGGAVSAHSPGPGQGATFCVQLPIAIVQQDSVGREHPAARKMVAEDLGDQVMLTNVRVLVVDDDHDACDMLKRVLEEREATVETAFSASEALEMMSQTEPHVLLSDIGMPEMDGYALIREIRSQGSRVPAVALTAFARSEDRIRALQAGYNMHVAKPFELGELLTVVAALAKVEQRT